MSKQFPDRHPKLRGDHGLLQKFRYWYKKCQDNEGVICIIPYQVKRDRSDKTPKERWPRKIEVVRPPKNPQEPVIGVKLVHGPLSQMVELSAQDMKTLNQLV